MPTLDVLYRRRALPPGSIRYLAWLFATPRSRDAWCGIFALQAEWRALLHAASDSSVAGPKLAWWHEEMLRLTEGRAVHPIGRFLAALPGAAEVDFRPLVAAIEAVAIEFSGAPLERAALLPAHADALYGGPLRVAAMLGGGAPEPALGVCTAAAAAGEYLARALSRRRHDAGRGFIAFPVDALLAAGIDNAELAAAERSPRLERYLEARRAEAVDWFERAAQALPSPARPTQRALLVLIDLERRRLAARRDEAPTPSPPAAPEEDNAGLADLWWAWRTARQATGGR